MSSLRFYHDEERRWLNFSATRFEDLNKELEIFRGVYNHRVRFFAALQEISDSVS